MGRKEEAYRRCELAIAMAEQIGDPATLAHARLYRAWTYEMAGDILLAEPMAVEVEDEVIQYLAAWDYAQWVVTTGYQYLIRGYPQTAINFIVARLDRIDRTGNLLMQTCAYLILYSQLTVVGRGVEGLEFRKEWRGKYDEEPDIPFLQSCKFCHYMLVAHELNDLDVAMGHARDMLSYGSNDYWTWAMWLVIGYICLERAELAGPDDLPEARRELDAAIERTLATGQLPVHQCHVAVLRAAAARFSGQLEACKPLLGEAVSLAEQCDSPWAMFEAARESARLARAMGDGAGQLRSADRALRIALDQGYEHRARRIREEFGVGVVRDVGPLEQTQVASSRYAVRNSRRAEALLEVSVASASSLDPIEQARAALDAIVRELGAERGFLLLLEEGVLQLRAGRTADGEDIDELKAYSSTVIQQVVDDGQGIVATGSDEGRVLGSESAVAHNLRSVMAAPLKVQGKLIGVVYVDSRLMRGLFLDDDLQFLMGIGAHLAISLQTVRMAQRETERVAMEKDLALTASMQRLFLPATRTVDQPGHFRISAHYRPMAQCSGDFWWYDTERPDPLLIVGDVTGHGAGAAMLAVSAVTFISSRSSSGVALLEELDRYLYGVTGGEMAIALHGIVFDQRRSEVRIIGAAALPAFHLRDGQMRLVQIPPSQPIGYGKGSFSMAEVQVVPGDRLFVYTDGLIEMPIGAGRQLGIKGVRRLFAATKGQSIEAATATIAEQADLARGDNDLDDDLSFFCIEIL